MAKAFITRAMGGAGAPSGELGTSRTIVGLSAGMGDPAGNNSQASLGTGAQHLVGWGSAYRNHLLQTQPVPSDVPPDAKVLSSRERFRVINKTGNPVGKTFVVYPVLRELEPDLAGSTFEEYKSGSDWGQFGGTLVGQDIGSPSLGSVVWTTQNATDLAASAVVYLDFATTARMQEWIDAGELPTYLMYEVASSVVDAQLRMSSPTEGESAVPHTYGEINYLYALQLYHSNADGTINLGSIIDPASNDTADHIFLGSVNRNSASAWAKGKPWVANTRDTARQCVFVDSGRAMPGGVDNSDAVGGWLRCVRVFNNTTGAGTGTYKGTWIIEVSGTDEVDISFLSADPGSVVEVITTGESILADITVTDGGEDRLFIPVDAWNGSPTTGDIFRVDTRADLHPSNASALDALEDVFLTYATGGDRNTPDPDHDRPALTAITQQLVGRDVSTIANSSGATGVIATVSSGGSWTHVKVADPTQFVSGQWATLTTALDERDGGRKVEVWIQAVYDLDDATYPGQVRLSTSAVSPVAVTSPTDFDASSLLTTGLALGTFTRPDATTLSAQANIASSALSFTAALESTGTVELEVFDFVNLQWETLTVALSGAGGTITGSGHPAYAYAAGSLVQVVEDTSRHPFFVSAQPELDTDLGRKRSFVVVDEWALVV